MSREKTFKNGDLRAILEERGKRIRRRVGQSVVSDVSNPELLSILREIGENNRDAFRPALTALSCEAVGGQPDAADDAALMFTLASAGFGIHDDIIDKSENKHFSTTLLGRYGLESALLVGDLLIVKAWTVINEMLGKVCSPEKIEAVVKEYGRLNIEICEAEYMGISFRKKLDTELKTHEKILWEAMAEIEACTRIGAILGNGSGQEVEALAEFGRRLGFTYRLADEVSDTLNIEGNLPHRIEHESVPLPILFAAKSSEQRHQRIQSIIQKSPITSTDIKELLEICFESESLEYVFGLAKKNEKKTISSLGFLKPSLARDSLSLLNNQSFRCITDLIL